MSRNLAILAVLSVLAACGGNRTERAISGAAIGAGVGAAGAAVLDRDLVSGAVLGGAVGAATGALTRREDFDLGDPLFNN